VVKGADQGMKFSWHQDSGYVGTPHTPYVTVWVTLDDVTVENGTVYILPYSKAGTRELVKHAEDPELRDKIGYTGDEEGIPVEIPAGSLAVFSSLVFHRSGANTTPRMRRIYLPQYSPEPIVKPDGEIHAFADPFLVDGVVQPSEM
jgi:ectoine hydroxylase-related dioxygenase (phytanoyl-CoA dioxygenase family)